MTRTKTTHHQILVLEAVFKQNKYPNPNLRKQLATDLNMKPRSLQKWFQNRRFKENTRRKKDIQKTSTTARAKGRRAKRSKILPPRDPDREEEEDAHRRDIKEEEEEEDEESTTPELFDHPHQTNLNEDSREIQQELSDQEEFSESEEEEQENGSTELLESLFGSRWFDVAHVFIFHR